MPWQQMSKKIEIVYFVNVHPKTFHLTSYSQNIFFDLCQLYWKNYLNLQILLRNKWGFLICIHTLPLNFLFSDWLFCKYAECIENVHCTLRTAPSLHKVLLVHDRACECHIDLPIFFHRVKLLIFFMFSGILKPFYLSFFMNMSKWFCFSVVYELS